MPEHHEIGPWIHVDPDQHAAFSYRDEIHVFDASPACGPGTVVGWISMRCHLRITGCSDYACTCAHHEAGYQPRSLARETAPDEQVPDRI